jgi:hypothetical protein
MRDPKESAIELLETRGQRDAARVLERCNITLRQLERRPTRLGEGPPLAEVLIHPPKELADSILGGSMPESDWSNQIERALREAAERDDFGILVIQWVGAKPQTPAGDAPPAKRYAQGGLPGREAGI